MTETLIAAVITFAVVLGSMAFGNSAGNAAWQQDCKKLGMHRSNNEVYKCELVKEPV